MAHTAHIPSHRKPRRSNATKLRAGVAGGVLSTLAVAGTAGSASAAPAAEPVTETLELPTLTADLSTQVARSASATQLAAATYELQAEQEQIRAQQDAAAKKAAAQAKKDRAEAVRKAEAEKAEERAAEAERKAAAERASRTAERTTLTTTAAANDTSPTGSTGSGSSGSAASSGSSQAGAEQSTPAPSSGNVSAVIAFLKAQVGDAYVMGGTGPNSWDCSGLVQAAFKQANISLPRTSQQQSTAGTQVGTSNLQVGDILYWGSAGAAWHTGVYIGNGQYLDAANPAKGVVIQDLSGYPADGAVRVL
ncbi:C40 family peptidase [Streptomyces sp. NPDC002490]|uniref:C40 family peptidase n=1 Tax=Streptomyces sp. NPDC002490 TaxID=3154416 RepID=UPI00331952A6